MDEKSLFSCWYHSDEEDSDGQLVFRKAEYSFPPRRMPRPCLTIEADGVAAAGSPGPADRSVAASETWSLDGDRLTISGSARLSGCYQVVLVDEQVLILRTC